MGWAERACAREIEARTTAPWCGGRATQARSRELRKRASASARLLRRGPEPLAEPHSQQAMGRATLQVKLVPMLPLLSSRVPLYEPDAPWVKWLHELLGLRP